ncbi:hypothetical protein MT418_004088 [Batrachochytrium dendrobatidis]
MHMPRTTLYCRLVTATSLIILFLIGLFLSSTSYIWSSTEWSPAAIRESDVCWNCTAEPNPVIPRIIHQTWKNESIPKKWHKAHGACKYWHKRTNWTHYFWTDHDTREFLRILYPDFLPTYDGYKYPIQRVDAVRYFILYEYGGIYMDLDIGCMKSLDPLLRYPAIIPKTTPIGFSNDFMASRPKHPLFKRLVDELPKSNHNWFLPYATVFFSTGPMFLNINVKDFLHKDPVQPQKIEYDYREAKDSQNQTYIKRLPKVVDLDSVYVLEPLLYSGGMPRAFFMHFEGNSWHSSDASYILYFWSSIKPPWSSLFMFKLVLLCCIPAGIYASFKYHRKKLMNGRKTRRMD